MGLGGGCGVGGWWMGVEGGWGVPPHMCTCTHVHAPTHTHMVNMIISCKWPPPLGESLGIPYDVVHVHACVCMCTCVGGTLLPPPTHIHPAPTPQWGTRGISQNSIALELIEIFQFRLKIWNLWRLPPPMGVLLGGWVGGWMGGLMGGVRSKH